MKKRKGFTLIELLAVIVILAIISLVAVPIVLNIINDSKKSAGINSAQNYIHAVEQGVASYLMSGNKIKNGTYKILSNGDICVGILSAQNCDGNVLDVDINGEAPIAGRVVIQEKTVISGKLKFNDKNIEKKSTGEFEYVDYVGDYELGDIILFNPGDGVKTWNVIGENENEVTLLSAMNIGEPTNWSASDDNVQDGPIGAMTYLNQVTSNWTIDSINNYSYVNESKNTSDEYKKLEIKNGVTIITNSSGNPIQVPGTTKARLITSEELYYLAEQFNPNYNEQNIRKYIEQNLEELSNEFLNNNQQATSVDNFFELQNVVPNHESMILFVNNLFFGYSAYFQYDVSLPKYLTQNLSAGEDSLGYWTLSSYNTVDDVFVPSVIYLNIIYFLESSNELSLRPVITIQKSLLGGTS